MESIYNLSEEELLSFLLENGYKKYRLTQIRDWLYKKKVSSFDEMTNLSKDLIALLKANFFVERLEIIKKEVGEDVFKYLLRLSDNKKVECVLMKQAYGNSLCVSSQVGCNMGCVFCESGTLKKNRNLSVSEMISQFLTVENDLEDVISNVVVMGIGEPFDNYDNVMNFLKILNDPNCLGIGKRHITVSTCGIIPKIKEFASSGLDVNLAISLHAPNDKLRSKLMPINRAYPLKELISVLKEYEKTTKKRITFEYILLSGVNDTKEHAYELYDLIKGMNCYVNLIPYNNMSNLQLKRAKESEISKFYDILRLRKILVTVRKEFGGNISASCGQLSSGYKEDK